MEEKTVILTVWDIEDLIALANREAEKYEKKGMTASSKSYKKIAEKLQNSLNA